MTESIVFLDRSAIPTGFRKPAFPHIWREYPETLPDFVVDRLRDATIAITNRVRLDDVTLGQLSKLRFIAVAATGHDIVDLQACERLGICVSNVRDWCTTSVAEHVFALIFALRRKLFDARDTTKSGAWQRSEGSLMPTLPPPCDLYASRIGVIGHGAIARRVAGMAFGLGMHVSVAEHKGAARVREGRISFDRVFRESDVVSVHCPLMEETRGLIGAREISLMKPKALLINCARGGVVDDRALANALVKGQLGGAGVDVLSEEPPRNGNPLLDLTVGNLIVTPHTAWVSESSLAGLSEQLIQNLESFVWGHPQNQVTLQSSVEHEKSLSRTQSMEHS